MVTSPQSPVARNVFRVLGAVLILGGLFLVIRGGFAIADSGQTSGTSYTVDGDPTNPFVGAPPTGEETTFSDGPGFGELGMVAGGLFMIVFGLGALNAGFIGAQARYAAGETAPAVREFGSALRGDPIGGVTPKSGKFCSECGGRNDDGARFCDACGHAIAPA